MSLSSKTELARALFRSTPPESVTRTSGTATADSSDGTVTVQLEDGDVIEVGTIGSVSAGDTVTIHVQRGEAQVIAAEGWGDAMQQAVDDAAAIAEATGQHFWHDSNGAHVTEVTADQWAQSQTGHNILVNSLGILLRKALNYIAAWTGTALSFYDGDGNAADNITASFGSSGAQIGKVDESHIEMDYHSLRLIDKDGNEYFEVEDLRDQSGTATVVDTWTGNGSTTAFALTYTATDTSYTVKVDGTATSATKTTSGFTLASAPAGGSTITAEYTTDRLLYAFTFGDRLAGAIGSHSSTFGYHNVASGKYSHAEGIGSMAVGLASHTEGGGGQARGDYSHAEGRDVEATGDYSHAQNIGTFARGEAQTAIGKYNVADSASALIIGNGTSINARSNALTVDWSGNVEAAGDVSCVDVTASGDVSGATLSSAGGLTLFGSTSFDGMFHLATKSTTIGAVSANGGTKTLTMDATLSGYAPIAISGWYVNGASRLHPYMLRLYNGNVQVYLCNNASSASSSSATIEVQVLYVKTA